MTRAELEARERTVEVSAATLAQICPESHLAENRAIGSRASRLWTALRVRARLLGMRIRFRVGDLRPLRCRVVSWRLKAKLAWMKMRHRGRLR